MFQIVQIQPTYECHTYRQTPRRTYICQRVFSLGEVCMFFPASPDSQKSGGAGRGAGALERIRSSLRSLNFAHFGRIVPLKGRNPLDRRLFLAAGYRQVLGGLCLLPRALTTAANPAVDDPFEWISSIHFLASSNRLWVGSPATVRMKRVKMVIQWHPPADQYSHRTCDCTKEKWLPMCTQRVNSSWATKSSSYVCHAYSVVVVLHTSDHLDLPASETQPPAREGLCIRILRNFKQISIEWASAKSSPASKRRIPTLVRDRAFTCTSRSAQHHSVPYVPQGGSDVYPRPTLPIEHIYIWRQPRDPAATFPEWHLPTLQLLSYL